MKNNVIEVPKAKMRLYSAGIDGPVFLDEKEYENFPEDGICGRVGERYYMRYEGVKPIEYIGDFDGKQDVFKEIGKDGKITFYTLDFMDSNIPEVLEGKLVNEKVVWDFSDIESLSHTYKGFRERGIEFSYDYYSIEEEKYRARERDALLRMQHLQAEKALLEKNIIAARERLNYQKDLLKFSAKSSINSIETFVRKLFRKN